MRAAHSLVPLATILWRCALRGGWGEVGYAGLGWVELGWSGLG